MEIQRYFSKQDSGLIQFIHRVFDVGSNQHASVSAGYRRHREFDESNGRGQDYCAWICDGQRVAITVCDGVSQSFMGDIAALNVAQTLVSFFWDHRGVVTPEDVQQALRQDMPAIRAEVENFVIPAGLPEMLRVEVERKRATVGSQVVFAAARLDLRTGECDVAILGDPIVTIRQQPFDRVEYLQGEPKARWGTHSQAESRVTVKHLSDVTHLAIMSDGINREWGARFDQMRRLEAFVERVQELGDADDMSFVAISRMDRRSKAPDKYCEVEDPRQPSKSASAAGAKASGRPRRTATLIAESNAEWPVARSAATEATRPSEFTSPIPETRISAIAPPPYLSGDANPVAAVVTVPLVTESPLTLAASTPVSRRKSKPGAGPSRHGPLTFGLTGFAAGLMGGFVGGFFVGQALKEPNPVHAHSPPTPHPPEREHAAHPTAAPPSTVMVGTIEVEAPSPGPPVPNLPATVPAPAELPGVGGYVRVMNNVRRTRDAARDATATPDSARPPRPSASPSSLDRSANSVRGNAANDSSQSALSATSATREP